jgi:hypothetical protein
MLYLKFDDGAFVVVEIAVIRSRENGDNCWKFLSSRPFIHFEPVSLSLMSTYDRNNFVFLKKLLSELASKEIGTSSHLIIFD